MITDERAAELLRKHRDTPLQFKHLGPVMEGVVAALREIIAETQAPLAGRLVSLEKEIGLGEFSGRSLVGAAAEIDRCVAARPK